MNLRDGLRRHGCRHIKHGGFVCPGQPFLYQNLQIGVELLEQVLK